MLRVWPDFFDCKALSLVLGRSSDSTEGLGEGGADIMQRGVDGIRPTARCGPDVCCSWRRALYAALLLKLGRAAPFWWELIDQGPADVDQETARCCALSVLCGLWGWDGDGPTRCECLTLGRQL